MFLIRLTSSPNMARRIAQCGTPISSTRHADLSNAAHRVEPTGMLMLCPKNYNAFANAL